MLKCLLKANSGRKTDYILWKLTTLTTSTTVSQPSPNSSPLASKKSEHEIKRKVSALSQWHTKLTSQDVFNAAWTHIHLKNLCVLLDGCFHPLLYPINTLITMEREFQVIWWLTKSVYEINFLLTPLIYLTFIKRKNVLSYLKWLQWQAFLYISNVIWWSQPLLAWYKTPVNMNHSSAGPSINR